MALDKKTRVCYNSQSRLKQIWPRDYRPNYPSRDYLENKTMFSSQILVSLAAFCGRGPLWTALQKAAREYLAVA